MSSVSPADRDTLNAARVAALGQFSSGALSAPQHWDDGLQVGMASGQPRFLVVGASDGTGYFADDIPNKAAIELIRNQLVAKFGVWGDFYHSRLNVVDSPQFTGTPPFVNNGAAPTQQLQGYGSLDTWAGINTDLLTFNAPYAATQLDVLTLDAAGASPNQYNLDAAGLVALPALSGTGKQIRLSLTGLSAIKHQIVLRQQTAAGLHCLGAAIYPTGSSAKSGLGFARMTYPGSAGMFYLRQDAYPSLFPNGYDIASYLANISTAPGVAPLVTDFGFPTNPHVVIVVLDLMGNDMNQMLIGANPMDENRSFEAVKRICSACRRAFTNVTFIFWIPSIPDGVYSDLLAANTVTNAPAWQSWKKRALDLAFSYQGAVYDQDVDIGNSGVRDGYQTNVNSGFHLTNKGQARAAAAIGTLLTRAGAAAGITL